MLGFTESQESFIRDNLPEIQSVSERNIQYIDKNGTVEKISIKDYTETAMGYVYQNPELAQIIATNKKQFIVHFKLLLSKIDKEIRLNDMAGKQGGDTVEFIKEELKNLVPCVDISNTEKILLINKDDFRVTPYDPKFFTLLYGWSIPDFCNQGILAKHIYNPRSKERMYKATLGTQEVNFLNVYSPPKWMETSIENPKIPTLFKNFMRHLFPLYEEREYVYDWLHKSLTDRAYVYLVLNGKKGVGKNTFKHFYRALHGTHNFVDGKKSLLTTQFNSQLDECRALVLDEVRYTEDEENVLKEIQNDNVSIERKGEDATRGSVIHCSIILMNNEAKDNFIAVDSRRFSPMTLGDKKLEESLTSEDIDMLIGKFKEDSPYYDPNFIAQIGHWILQKGRNKRWGKEDCYKGPRFHELVQTSLSEWRKYIIAEVRALKNSDNDMPLRLSEIAEAFGKKFKSRKVFPDYTRVVNFCHYYRDKEGKRLLDIKEVPEEGDYEIFPFEETEHSS